MYRHNVSKKRRKGCWTDCVQSTEWSVTRGNRQKEEETVMTAFPVRHSYPSILAHTQTRRRGGMGAREKRRDRGESGADGEGLQRTGVWIREIKTTVWKEQNRISKNGEERRGIEGEISLISGSFTHSRPSFPFPPIISSHPVLGRVGGVFFCAVRWCHSFLYRLQKAPPPSAQHPIPPPARPLKTPPQTFLNSGTFSDLSRYVGRHPRQTWPCIILT